MSMPDHIKLKVLPELFAKKVSFSWKTAKLDSFVLPEWRTRTHIENMLPIWSRGSVAHFFNLLHNVRYRTTERTAPNRRQRFESSCNQLVFNFFLFYIGSACSRSLFSFANILYFMWLTSFDLILL